MQTNYKNWVPNGMISGFVGATLVTASASVALSFSNNSAVAKYLSYALGAASIAMACGSAWCIYAHHQFFYHGKRKLSKHIIDGVAHYINVPEGGTCLDIGCGSGALTIAAAKTNPRAKCIGCDRWGIEYASFSKQLCENNAVAENIKNTEFVNGDATHLPFENESFDCVISNYVYHNIPGDKQKWLLETLRVLKKGGTFAIHDIMSKNRYGDMKQFIQILKNMGYEKVELMDTDNGLWMSSNEALLLGLRGSKLLYGKK